jgi:hypothetical protein
MQDHQREPPGCQVVRATGDGRRSRRRRICLSDDDRRDGDDGVWTAINHTNAIRGEDGEGLDLADENPAEATDLPAWVGAVAGSRARTASRSSRERGRKPDPRRLAMRRSGHREGQSILTPSPERAQVAAGNFPVRN